MAKSHLRVENPYLIALAKNTKTRRWLAVGRQVQISDTAARAAANNNTRQTTRSSFE